MIRNGHIDATTYRVVELYDPDRILLRRGRLGHIWREYMKRKSLVALASAACVATTLSGCYVIPIDPRYPQAPGQSPYVGQSSTAVPLPTAQAVPVLLQARLYPLNDMAGKTGALSATITDSVNGHATFSLNHGGELLQGEASRVAAGYPGFGNVHREVYGDGRMPSGQRGIASAVSAHGTYVNCEYALNAPNRGTGACLFSNGAKYQLHFGS
jgi:hypothetical protein